MNLKSYIILTVLSITCNITLNAQILLLPTISKSSDIDNKSYTGIISEQYANGTPFLWKTLINGKANGIWLEWYADGTLRYRANWKNNLGEGKWEYFHPNGKLRSESFYIEDRAFGIYRSYYENGQLQTDVTFANDKKVGIELVYNIDGTLKERKRYDDGIQDIDQPILFQPGLISTSNNNEWGINFEPDGNTA
jgi:antitoxin component YwqK of YwqJK toxin-antitoxin module